MTLKPLLRRSLLLLMLGLSSLAWAADVTWIDVRTPEEFSQKHVPDAVNIPYDRIGDEIAALNLDKDSTIYVYCHSGRRAGIAKETLDAMGYTHVVNKGGVDDALAEVAKAAQQ